jgi:periplasmic copper chaperone A
MRKLALEIFAAAALTLAAILASAPGVMASDVMVINGFARASATPQATSAVAYVTLMNHGGEADRLLSIVTPAAAVATVHETTSVDGVMKMKAVPVLALAAGATVEMKPGGSHIMLMGLKAPLKRGGKLTLELTFEKAGKASVEVPIGGVAATGHDQDSTGG